MNAPPLLAAVVALLLTPHLAGQVDPLAGQLDVRTRGCEADDIWQGQAIDDHLGHSLSVGDWNGDGKDDFISGNLVRKGQIANQGLTSGKAWLYLGGDTTGLPHVSFTDIAVVGDFAPTVAFIGDIGGDGKDDIAIGAMGHGNHHLGPKSGAVWIFLSDDHQSATPLTLSTSSAALIISPPVSEWMANEQPHFGFSIAAVGDVNGDGQGDLLIGAPGPLSAARPGQEEEDDDFVPGVHGRALVYHGTHPSTWPTTGGFVLGPVLDGDDVPPPGPGATVGDRFGWSVASVGDLDGDSHPDVAIGAVEAAHVDALDFNTFGTGYAHVYFGDGAGLTNAQRIDPVPGVGGALAFPKMFGHVISGGVSLDDDTRPELLIGSPLYSVDSSEHGAVYAYSFLTTKVRQDAFPDIQPIFPSDAIVPPGSEAYLGADGRFG